MTLYSIKSCEGNFDGLVLPSDPHVAHSLSARALRWGARNSWLNPPNEGQGYVSRFLGKPLRAAARLIYALVVTTVFPVLSVVYQSVSVWAYVGKVKIAEFQGKNETAKYYSDVCMTKIRAAATDIFFITGFGIPSLVGSLLFMAGGKQAANFANGVAEANPAYINGKIDIRQALEKDLKSRKALAEAHKGMLEEISLLKTKTNTLQQELT